MSDYVPTNWSSYLALAGSAASSYGKYQSGKWQQEYLEKTADYETEKAAAELEYKTNMADIADEKAQATYDESVNELRRKAAASIAKGGASGFVVSSGSFMSSVEGEYGYGEEIAKKRFDTTAKINLEERKLAQAAFETAEEMSLLKKKSGEQAYTSSLFEAGGSLFGGLSQWAEASKGK